MMSNPIGRINDIDRRILGLLQRDCRLSISEIAENVGLSKSACHRRIQGLERANIILGYGARINPAALGYELHFMIDVRLSTQNDEVMKAFERGIASISQVLECQLMSGQNDYLLRVAARNVEDYEALHLRLTRLPGVSTVVSSLALRTVKRWSGLPVSVD